jgi:hypothetical protein
LEFKNEFIQRVEKECTEVKEKLRQKEDEWL